MTLLGKKEKIVINSEQQKDNFIERLDKAHVEYDIKEEQPSMFSNRVSYIFRVSTKDLKKVV